MELPKEFKGEVHFYYWPLLNSIVAYERKVENGDFVYLGSKYVEAEFKVSHEEAVSQLVSGLQAEKRIIQAKAQSELNKLDEKINSLLAIDYDGGE